jgi:hypothetical protein
MATVDATQISRITDAESGTWINVPSGGGSPGASTEVFLQGATSFGKRLSNVTDVGFAFDSGAGADKTGRHIGLWVFYLHYAAMTALKGILVTDTSNYGRFNRFTGLAGANPYPSLGGWVRIWIDADRTPDAENGTFDKTSVRYFGMQVSAPAVGSGNASNAFIDAIDDVALGDGLLLTGTAGLWQDFLDADEGNTTNKYGVVISLDGVIYCLGRLKLGSSSSLVFNDSGFVIIFPDQPLVASDFMGVTIDLQNGSTNIDWANGVIKAPGTQKGDLVVAGTSGAFDAASMSISGLRIITLTAACSLTDSTVTACGQILAGGASLINTVVSDSSDASALLWDVASDPDGKLDGMSFISGGTGHAVQFGTNTPGDPSEITLRDVSFSGYGANDTTDAAIYNNSGKHLIINIVGGTTPTVRNGSGASTTLVINPITVEFTGLVNGSEIRVYDSSDNSELAGIENVVGNSFSFPHTPEEPLVTAHAHIIKNDYEFIRLEGIVLDQDRSIPIQQRLDRNYSNP